VTTRERDELRLKVAAIDDKRSKVAMSPPASGNAVSMKDIMMERKAYEAEVSKKVTYASTHIIDY
jgi:hypothetical protein